jgi:hypothetical protein
MILMRATSITRAIGRGGPGSKKDIGPPSSMMEKRCSVL